MYTFVKCPVPFFLKVLCDDSVTPLAFTSVGVTHRLIYWEWVEEWGRFLTQYLVVILMDTFAKFPVPLLLKVTLWRNDDDTVSVTPPLQSLTTGCTYGVKVDGCGRFLIQHPLVILMDTFAK